MKIIVGARKSPLSQAQVKEVLDELLTHHPEVDFISVLIDTHGDLNPTISLRTLDKTDFFTRELDQMLLTNQCRITIHSAKDLPEPLPEGLEVIALTKGISSSDALVFREGESLETLPPGAIIATSSDRRENIVRQLRSDLRFVDLRGSIGQRLAILDTKEVDGVVVAEAALIRLHLTHLNRLLLPGQTAKNQGQLAVVARSGDEEISTLFSCMDSRKMKVLA